MKIILTALLLFVSSTSFASRYLEVGTVYRGLGPTDESASALSEVEVFVINETTIQIKYATGHELDIGTMNVNDFEENKEMSMKVGYPVFTSKTSDAKFLFAHPISLKGALMRLVGHPAVIFYTGGMGDLMTPVILFSSSQLRAGKLERAIEKIEKQVGKGSVPRIAYGGKAPNQFCSYLFQ